MLTLEEMQRRAREDSLEIQRMSLAISENLKGIAEQTKKITEDEGKSSDKSDRFQRTWTRIAVTLAVAALAIAALSYFAPDFGRQVVSNLTGAWPSP